MKVIYDFRALRTERTPTILAAGFFDGVHRGHLAVIAETKRLARLMDGQAWVLTFNTHPLKVLRPQVAPPMLTSTAHRIAILRRLKLEGCLVLPFTRQLAGLDAACFVRRLVKNIPSLRAIVVGYNWRFGYMGRGTPGLLRRLGREIGLAVVTVPPVLRKGRPVSSTRIRREISRGHLREASLMLGRPFSVLGTVVKGRNMGRRLGFPTANLDPHNEVLPPRGVYAVYAYVAGETRPGVVNLGVRPTFGGPVPDCAVMELHIIDFDRTLYGKEIEVFFIRRLRGEKRFASVVELRRQIAADVARSRSLLAVPGSQTRIALHLGHADTIFASENH